MQDEIAKYIDDCYEHERLDKLKDVYVTDHSPVDPKLVTASDEEDQDFFEYQQSIDAYHSSSNK